jgi:hypothetical protein
MTRCARRGVILTLLLSAACEGSGVWIDRLQADPLYRRASDLRKSPACAALVPMEYGRTIPVPVRDNGRDLFRVLYYPTVKAPHESMVISPAFEGRFSADDADVGNCPALAAAEFPTKLGPAVPPGMSMTRLTRTEVALFESLERVAALYFKGDPAQAKDKQALADFLDAFQTISEPGLTGYYYRLNPDFWEWLRREGGRSIPKPS